MRQSIILLVALCLGIAASIAQGPEALKTDGQEVVYNVADLKPETMPKFQGSDDLTSCVIWVSQNVKYPTEAKEQGISGRVIVQFVVDAQGRVASESVELLKGEDILFAEVARVLAESPQWEPGADQGKSVPVQFVIPVVFTL